MKSDLGYKFIKVQGTSFQPSKDIEMDEICLGDRGLGNRITNKHRLFFKHRLAKKYWKSNLKGHFDYQTSKE